MSPLLGTKRICYLNGAGGKKVLFDWHICKRASLKDFYLNIIHQSFGSTAPLRPGNSGAFNLKARHCGGKFVVKFLVADNNKEQQLEVVSDEKDIKDGLEFLNVNVQVHLQIECAKMQVII